MKFLIVAPFIRFRKEGYLSRHVVIAEEIANSGNEVFVITSKFSHSRKKNRNFRNYSENGVSYFLISELGYNSNRTFKRFLSHFILSINIFIFLLKFKFLNRHKFDIIISTLPLGFLSILLSIFARLNKILLFIDIQDKWPDIFIELCNRKSYPIINLFKKLIIFSSLVIRASLCKLSNGCFAVSQEYLKWFTLNIPKNFTAHHVLKYNLYLGSQLELEIKAKKELNYSEKEKINFLIFGSLVESYDFNIPMEAIKKLNESTTIPRYFLKIIGSGPKYEEIKKSITNIKYIKLLNEITFTELKFFIDEADFLINPLHKSATQSVSNRLCDYIASNKPIFTSYFPPELEKLKSDFFLYDPENVNSLKNKIFEISNLKKTIFKPKKNYRALFYREFSYPIFVEKLISISNKNIK